MSFDSTCNRVEHCLRRRTLDNNRQVTKHAVFRSLHIWQRALRGTWDICNGFSPTDLRSEHRNIRPLSREVHVRPDPARRVSAAPAPKPPPRTRKSGENGALRLQVRLLHPTTGSKSRPFCNSDRDVSTVQHSMDAYGRRPYASGLMTCPCSALVGSNSSW